MEASNVRSLVLDMLLMVEREEAYSHLIIRDVLEKYDYLPTKEKAFMKRLFEGTLERRIEMDYYLDAVSSLPVEKMKPLIRNLLRMSAYQILYMDAVPDAAAVSEAVKLAAKRRFVNLKGFVNGVLRKLSAKKNELRLPDENRQPAEYLQTACSVPAWMAEHFLSIYPYGEAKSLLFSLLEVRPVSVRFLERITEGEREEVLTKIRESGVRVREHPYADGVFYFENCENLSLLPGFLQGAFTVQDAGSVLAVRAAGIRRGDKVLDVCAAPGGKSVLAAELAGPEGIVEARDVSEARAERIRENLERTGLANVRVKVWDATVPDETAGEWADVVLADVPCSGLGVIGRKRDIKYRQKPEGMAAIAALQKDILRQVSGYVKPGGILLYSTCTINPAENEETAEWIRANLGFEPVSLEEEVRGLPCVESAGKGYVQLLPKPHDADGFFFAKFKKV